MDGLTSFLDYFQITEMAFRNEVLEKFADIKHNFKARDERSNRIRINFAEHPQQFFDIEVPESVLRSYCLPCYADSNGSQVVKDQFDPVIQDWVTTIRCMCEPLNTEVCRRSSMDSFRTTN